MKEEGMIRKEVIDLCVKEREVLTHKEDIKKERTFQKQILEDLKDVVKIVVMKHHLVVRIDHLLQIREETNLAETGEQEVVPLKRKLRTLNPPKNL